MSEKRRLRGRFDRNDPYRALITDTAPDDVPLIFSNDGFRANMLRLVDLPSDVMRLVDATIISSGVPYTIPFRYKISHKNGRLRQLSLAHPSSQVRAVEFYEKYSHLITDYTKKSGFSIRFPVKVASSFFFKSAIADINRYKRAGIDHEDTDQLSRNPSSYFAYGGYRRFHRFFSSDEYFSLEKKFKHMAMLDVSKCFSSIYTHTITWAVKDMPHGKENVKAISFGNEFDKLMRKMNFDETNGIAVGPEISRICAEIILQSVDDRLKRRLDKLDLIQSIDYQIRRYVDDYIVFSNSLEDGRRIEAILADELEKINLHLNDEKAERLERPFQTKMSSVSDAVSKAIERFWSASTIRQGESDNLSIGIAGLRGSRLSRIFIQDIKALCHDRQSDYSAVSPLIIAAMNSRVQRIVDSFDRLSFDDDGVRHDQYRFLAVLLDIIYFFYSVHPTVSSSYSVARSTLLSVRFVRKNFPELVHDFSDFVMNLALEYLDKPISNAGVGGSHVPIEQLNMMLAISELKSEYLTKIRGIFDRLIAGNQVDYFSIVSLIFVARRSSVLFPYIPKMEALLSAKFIPVMASKTSSQDIHLIFDLLSCPNISEEFKNKLILKLFRDLDIGDIGKDRRRAVISEFEQNPWFVQWDKIDLLQSLEKRELNAVY